MKRIISIRKSAFLTLCYLQSINPAAQGVTAQKSTEIGISLKISIKDKFGQEISQANVTSASAGIATETLTFDFQNGPNSINVYNDSCGTKKQEIGRLLVTQKDAPKGSEIVLQGTTSEIRISLKKPEKNLSKDTVDEKATTSTMPSSLLEQIRAGKELKSKENLAPLAPPLIVEPSPKEQVKITLPADRAEFRKERRRKKQQNKNTQNPTIPVVLGETDSLPETPKAPPAPELLAPSAPPFITETSSITPSNAPTPDSLRQALLDQIREGKQPKTRPARSTPVVSTQTEATQEPSSRDELLKAIQGGAKLKKRPTQESTESVATPSRPASSGGIISDELMQKFKKQKEYETAEEQEDADDEEWD